MRCKYHRVMLTNLPVWRQSKHTIRSLIFSMSQQCSLQLQSSCSVLRRHCRIQTRRDSHKIISTAKSYIFKWGFPWRCQHSWLWCQDSQLPTAYLRRCEKLACCENSWVKFIFFKSSFDSWNWGLVVVQLFHRFLSLYARGKRGPFRSETHFEILSCEAPLCLRVGIPLLHHFCNPTLLAWMVQFDSQGSR